MDGIIPGSLQTLIWTLAFTFYVVLRSCWIILAMMFNNTGWSQKYVLATQGMCRITMRMKRPVAALNRAICNHMVRTTGIWQDTKFFPTSFFRFSDILVPLPPPPSCIQLR